MRIFDYAKVAEWESRLQKLADMAEKERWTYRSVPSSMSDPILDGYLRYTFIRVHEQERVAEVAKFDDRAIASSSAKPAIPDLEPPLWRPS